MARWTLVAAWFVLALAGQAQRLCAEEPPALPDFPCSPHAAQRYFEAARKFVAEQPESPHAPSVMHGMAMLAKLGQMDAIARNCQARLVTEYPKSVAALSMVAELREPADFRRILSEYMEGLDGAMVSKETAPRLASAVELGARRFGPKFFEDEAFLVDGAVLLDLAGHGSAGQLRAMLGGIGSPKARDTARIYFDTSRPASEKLVELSKLGDDAPSNLAMQVLWRGLSAEEQRKLEPRRAHLTRLWNSPDNLQKLTIWRLLRDTPDDDPQLHFWRVWSGLIDSHPKQVEESLAALRTKHADTAWAKRAAELVNRVGKPHENIDAAVDALLAAIAKLKAETSGIEFTIRDHATGDGRYQAYFAIQPSERMLELQVRDHDELLAAYSARGNEVRMYAAGDARITQCAQGAVFPAVRFHFGNSLRPNDMRIFRYWGDWVAGDKFAAGLATMFDTPPLASRDNLRGSLVALILSGYLPCPMQATEGEDKGRALVWIKPDARTGELTTHEVRFDEKGRFAGVTLPAWRIENVRYADDAAYRKTTPKWPDLSKAERREFDSVTFGKVLGTISRLSDVSRNANSTESEKQPDTNRAAHKTTSTAR